MELVESNPVIVPELDGTFTRTVYPVRDVTPQGEAFLNRLRKIFTDKRSYKVARRLKSNEPYYPEEFGDNMPASTFFTYLKELNSIVVESALPEKETIPGNHEILYCAIDYVAREKRGNIVRSGNVGVLTFRERQVLCALFDSLTIQTPITILSPEYPILSTLIENNIVPLTSEGKPVVFA